MLTLQNPKTRILLGLLSLLALACFGSGCAGPSGASVEPKPGRGIAEYRKITKEAHRSVAATVKSLETLAKGNAQTSSTYPGLARFDDAVSELEVTSVRARARVEAIIARGKEYFQEWKGRLATETNQVTAAAEKQQYTRLFEHFEHVRQRSGEVREEFRPFMAELREFRARLDRSPNPSLDPAPLRQIDGLIARGRRVLQTLEAISAALDETEKELHATLAAKR
jgi:hypothetical protein